MEDLDNNLKYTCGLPVEYFRYNSEGLPSTYAMIWCMMATEISRIFTKEDMKEFLFRLPVALHSMDLVETWLLKDRLMNYKYKGKPQVLKLEDVIMHYGLEANDHYINYSEPKVYLQRVSSGITVAMLVGYYGDFSVIDPEIAEDYGELISGKKNAPEITRELISKAEFFAGDLMKFIPEKTFTESSQVIKEKEKELEERRERIRNIPVFDIKKIPADIILQCLEIMYKDYYIKQLLGNMDEFEKKAKPLIYLAWLIANNFMILDGLETRETEGITLNYKDYELEGGGFNLGETIEMYNLEEMRPILKGLFF